MRKYIVHVEDKKESEPRSHERKTAEMLAELFKSDIIFIRRVQSKTPDLFVLKTNICWELKSPIGNGKHTIQNNLRDASKQSENIILDLTRTKMTDKRAISRTKDFLKKEQSVVKRLKILTKDKRIMLSKLK